MRAAGRADRDHAGGPPRPPLPVEIAVTALPSPSGFGAVAFVRDIRPRKEAEERERQRQQRLVEARTALDRSQKLEAVGKLTGGVAHDFNNILHIISANVQLMMRNEESTRKRLLSIMDAVERGRSWPRSCWPSRAASRCIRAWSARRS
jgi:signal transduction histidine kinase